MFPFRENTFACADGAYASALEDGRKQAAELGAIFLLLGRNIAGHVVETSKHVEATGSLFADYAVQVLENDSTDDTVQRLRSWAGRNPNVAIESRILKRKKWGMVRSGQRGRHMAEYRTLCQQLSRNAIEAADIVIVADSDLAGWSLDGILHTCSRWGKWDAMFSNGLRRDRRQWVQADAWALRQHTWDAKPFSAIRGFVPKRGAPLVPVKSAFGGLGVYRADAYAQAVYAGGDCEHVQFHRTMIANGHSRLFINPSQIVVYRW